VGIALIVKDADDDRLYDQERDYKGESIEPEAGPPMFQEFIHVYHEIRERATHIQLHEDLVEHMWIHTILFSIKLFE
jgi:hypothetical protein